MFDIIISLHLAVLICDNSFAMFINIGIILTKFVKPTYSQNYADIIGSGLVTIQNQRWWGLQLGVHQTLDSTWSKI